MKTFISLSALFISLSLTAQSNPATWYLNDGSGSGIQSPTNTASGDYSTAMGYETTASGYASTATGSGTIASGFYSTAIGIDTVASGQSSTAIGDNTTASESSSTAMGNSTTASGESSTAMGYDTNAEGHYSTAFGYETKAADFHSTAMGYKTTASELNSTAMGDSTTASGESSTAMGSGTTAIGRYSTASGFGTNAIDYGSFVIGLYNQSNTAIASQGSLIFTPSLDAFIIGNGTNSESRSNALVVKFNGETTLAGNLNVNSDARLKANIVSLGSTLAKLLQIDGKSYTMKKDESEKQKIGLLAQDIEKVFPELVSESNGIKSVNYQGLVPVLINALKEQQVEIDRLKTQEERLDRLERLVAAMD